MKKMVIASLLLMLAVSCDTKSADAVNDGLTDGHWHIRGHVEDLDANDDIYSDNILTFKKDHHVIVFNGNTTEVGVWELFTDEPSDDMPLAKPSLILEFDGRSGLSGLSDEWDIDGTGLAGIHLSRMDKTDDRLDHITLEKK